MAHVELEVDKCLLNMMHNACKLQLNTRTLDLAARINCRVQFLYAVEWEIILSLMR